MRNPRVLQLIMDSLRYWVPEMHVDGFRFDLASTLARELHEVDKLGAFFDIIHQDPVISQVKLIAEPWDLGEGGYQVGNFPVVVVGMERQVPRLRSAASGKGTAAWFRNSPRGFCGSSDLYEWSSRRPHASINFITCHDGFTLDDLVSYDHKHNEANGEDNRDGSRRQPQLELRRRRADRRPGDPRLARAEEAQPAGHAASVAGGADAAGRRRDRPHAARQQQRLLPGQRDLTWLNWDLTPEQEDAPGFVRRVITALPRAARLPSPALLSRPGIQAPRPGHRLARSQRQGNVATKPGTHASSAAWACSSSARRSMSMTHGETIRGDTILVLFNADHTHKIPFTLPASGSTAPWELVFDTANPDAKWEPSSRRSTSSTSARWPSSGPRTSRSRARPSFLGKPYQKTGAAARDRSRGDRRAPPVRWRLPRTRRCRRSSP